MAARDKFELMDRYYCRFQLGNPRIANRNGSGQLTTRRRCPTIESGTGNAEAD